VFAAASLGATFPAAAQAPLQAVPRAGVSFTRTVTERVKIEEIDPDTRTLMYSTNDGRMANVAVSDSVRNLDAIPDESMADVTVNEVVTLLNLRQKGPGAKEARREASDPVNAAGRFTLTVVGVDLAANMVSVIDGRGGPVQTYAADSIAKKEMLKKIKVGDVVIGLTTPLLITAIMPAK
jgi:hypothetical protein